MSVLDEKYKIDSKASFYPSDLIQSKLICPNCEERFVNPLNMPCSHNICSNCFKNMRNEIPDLIECPVCHTKNPIPEDIGFPINNLIAELLDLQPVKVKRGKEFEKLIESTNHLLYDLNKLIAELNDKLNTSESRISSTCSDLREEVNFSANSKIDQLNKYREEFLEQINEYQKKCLSNFQSNILTERKEMIDKSMLDLDEWNLYVNYPSSDDDYINDVKVLAENLRNKLEKEKFSFDLLLFGKERISFIKNDSDLLSDAIGKIKFERVQSEQSDQNNESLNESGLGEEVKTEQKNEN